LELRSVDEWQSADERNTREKITRARQAAEELFKPAQHNAEVKSPPSSSSDGTATEQLPRRQPRIFTVAPRLPVTSEVEAPTAAPQIPRKGIARRSTATVPPAQIGRVRALATYGMTPRQVADLYGVTTDEIDRILKARV
jgi:hypothetical protein